MLTTLDLVRSAIIVGMILALVIGLHFYINRAGAENRLTHTMQRSASTVMQIIEEELRFLEQIIGQKPDSLYFSLIEVPELADGDFTHRFTEIKRDGENLLVNYFFVDEDGLIDINKTVENIYHVNLTSLEFGSVAGGIIPVSLRAESREEDFFQDEQKRFPGFARKNFFLRNLAQGGFGKIFARSGINLPSNSYVVGDIGTMSIAENSVKFGSAGTKKITGNLTIGPGGDPETVIEFNAWGKDFEFFIDLTPEQEAAGVQKVENFMEPIDFSLPDLPVGLSNTIFRRITNSNGVHDEGEGTIPIVGPWPNQSIEISGSGIHQDELRITQNAVLTVELQGGQSVIRVKDLFLGQGNIVLSGEGELIIHVEDNLDIMNNSKVNHGGDVSQLKIIYYGTNTVNGFDVRFDGLLYAPEAEVSFLGSSQVKGNIIADYITLGSSPSCFIQYEDVGSFNF